MSADTPSYRKLPGRGRTWMGYDRLWQDDDHLLVVKTRGFAEHYERYYFRDVQALLLRRTPGHGRRLGMIGALVALLLLVATLVPTGRGVWLTLATIATTFLAIEWLLGPTSVVHLRTPLQTVELRSLRRLRNARRVLGELQIRIGDVQGAMSAEQIAAGLPEVAAQPEAPAVSNLKLAKPPPLPSRYRGAWHWALFSALLLEATVTSIQLGVDNNALDFGAMLLYLAEVCLAITAVVAQHRSPLGAGLKRLSWAALALLAAIFVSMWALGFAQMLNLAESGSPATLASPFDAPGVLFHYIFTLIGAAVLGLWGVLLLMRRRRSPAGMGGASS